ncbi:lactonase family protein [Nitrospira sp. BLG_2]|uniref:lactonase family protein n=1 Tax=Nitrospira sp. BLG_2 TaxID=3397507 RepID=UPI003B9B5D29
MIIYVANAGSRDISVLEMNERDGSIRLIGNVPATGEVMHLATGPGHQYLYASLTSDPPSVSSWIIDSSTGKLRPVQTIPAVDKMAYLFVDRSGRYLLGASYFGDKISVHAVGARGEINPKPQSVISTGKHPHCIVTDPSNAFVFVPTLGADAIEQYRFAEMSGELTPNSPPAVATKKGAGPRHLVFHPDGRLAFCSNELDGTVNMYDVGRSGTLTQRGSISVMPPGFKKKPWAADIHISPDGKCLYISERSSSTIAAFRINHDTLTLIGHYPTEAQPRGFNIDPGGKYLLAVGEQSNSLSTYEIDGRTGALRQRARVNVGQGPNWIEIIPLSK